MVSRDGGRAVFTDCGSIRAVVVLLYTCRIGWEVTWGSIGAVVGIDLGVDLVDVGVVKDCQGWEVLPRKAGSVGRA